MNAMFKTVVFLIAVLFAIIGGAAVFGYGCKACNSVDDISEAPCVPVLSNGDTNPHYKNEWYACKRSCIGKRNIKLNVKTCDCSCE